MEKGRRIPAIRGSCTSYLSKTFLRKSIIKSGRKQGIKSYVHFNLFRHISTTLLKGLELPPVKNKKLMLDLQQFFAGLDRHGLINQKIIKLQYLKLIFFTATPPHASKPSAKKRQPFNPAQLL